MPNTLPTDPSDTLAQILATPSSGPGASPEADQYEDQPRMDVLTHYMATGQMPQTESVRPGGIIGMLAQKFGLMPTSRPLPQNVRDQAILAQQAMGQQGVARKLAEIQAITPGATQFGSDYGRSVMHQVDPSLESAFPAGLKGSGELAQEATDQRATAAENKLTLEESFSRAREEASQGRLDAAKTIADAALMRMQTGEDREKFQEEQGTAAPINKIFTAKMSSIDNQRKALYTAMASSINPDTTTHLELRLKELQDEEQSLFENYGQSPKTPSDLFKKPKGAKSTAPATSSTKSGPALIDPNLFK